MIYFKLFYKFLIVGLFSFGGAYSSIPLVRDAAMYFENFNDETFADFIAISECTPGPITINMATFVGTDVGGLFGALIATIAVSLPAFLIILAIFSIFKNSFDNPKVKFVLSIVRPTVVGILMAMAINMIYKELKISALLSLEEINIKYFKDIIILIILLIFMKIYDILKGKKISILWLICIGGVFGIVINVLL